MIDFSRVDGGELNQALRRAHDEIVNLRRRAAELEPKAHAYDTIAQLSRLTMQEERLGAEIDVTWQIKTLLERAHKEETSESGDQ